MHASDPAIGALARLPQWVILAALAVLMIVGIAVRGVVGAVAFGLVTVFLAWLLYLSWQQLRPLDRLARAAVIVLTLGVTIVLAFTDQNSGNSTPFCSKIVSPVFQFCWTTSRFSHVTSS